MALGRAACVRVVWTAALWWCALAWGIAAAASGLQTTSYAAMTRSQVHVVLDALYREGRFVELERTARQIMEENPAVAVEPSTYTSVYEFMGVAQYSLGELDKAIATFEAAVKAHEDDTTAWGHLGNCYLYKLEIGKAIKALEVAVLDKGATHLTHQLFKARNWVASWRDRDAMLAQVDAHFRDDAANDRCTGATGLDFVELDAPMIKQMAIEPRCHEPQSAQPLCCRQHGRELALRSPRLRVGFISSDFGVHPVVTLMRGLLETLARDTEQDVAVYCFSLTTASSWWKRNITRTVDHMVSLLGKSPSEAAAAIHSHNIHVLIDLNGHTLHSGLSIFSHRPAPVQMTFLGYPMTTGNPNIDYFISDPVSTPPEMADALFSEKMLLLPTHYIANDHMQLLGHTIQGDRPSFDEVAPHHARIPASDGGGDRGLFVFATFSNWQKMDPLIFSAWMAIMARVPISVMWFIRSQGHAEAEANLRDEAFAHGIDGDRRLVFTDYQPWVHHTYGKRAADLILDTSLKNGHTTILDALFAGVPVITLEGNRMSNRAASSALHALHMHELTANSIKGYVELAVELATDRDLLDRLRATTEQRRLAYPLFDTRLFTHQFSAALRSAWHVGKSQRLQNRMAHSTFRSMHVFTHVHDAPNLTPRFFDIHTAFDDDEDVDPYAHKVVQALLGGDHILLHVGGQIRRDDWWIVNIEDHEHVDFVLPMDKLYPFPDNSVAVIYASHVLEHVPFGVEEEVRHTLDEWFRVLKPGGSLFVSVPDLAILSALFVNDTLSEQEQFSVMRMIHGGQTNEYDVHKVGFNQGFLAAFLENAGFCEIKRVDNFGLFADASSAEFKGVPISLNVMARACKPGGEWIQAHFAHGHTNSRQQ